MASCSSQPLEMGLRWAMLSRDKDQGIQVRGQRRQPGPDPGHSWRPCGEAIASSPPGLEPTYRFPCLWRDGSNEAVWWAGGKASVSPAHGRHIVCSADDVVLTV